MCIMASELFHLKLNINKERFPVYENFMYFDAIFITCLLQSPWLIPQENSSKILSASITLLFSHFLNFVCLLYLILISKCIIYKIYEILKLMLS